MNTVMQQLVRLIREEDGTEVVEWALVGGLIVAVGAAIFEAIGGHVSTHLGALRDALATTPAAE